MGPIKTMWVCSTCRISMRGAKALACPGCGRVMVETNNEAPMATTPETAEPLTAAMSAPEEVELPPWDDQRLVDAGWPHALRKAVSDPFDYALQLRDGSVWFFEHATPDESLLW